MSNRASEESPDSPEGGSVGSSSAESSPQTRGAEDAITAERNQRYWRTNLSYLAVLLSIWAVVSYGCGILFVDQLDAIRVGGFKLGFWFAQQGSIYVFVILIVVYVVLMNRLEAQHRAGRRLAAPSAPTAREEDAS